MFSGEAVLLMWIEESVISPETPGAEGWGISDPVIGCVSVSSTWQKTIPVVTNLVWFMLITLFVLSHPLFLFAGVYSSPWHRQYSVCDYMCNEYMNKKSRNKTLTQKSTAAHAILHPWWTAASFLGLQSLSSCHERINGVIIRSFMLTFRIIGWQSWKGPERQSPVPVMKANLRQISRNPHLSGIQGSRKCKCWNPLETTCLSFSL